MKKEKRRTGGGGREGEVELTFDAEDLPSRKLPPCFCCCLLGRLHPLQSVLLKLPSLREELSIFGEEILALPVFEEERDLSFLVFGREVRLGVVGEGDGLKGLGDNLIRRMKRRGRKRSKSQHGGKEGGEGSWREGKEGRGDELALSPFFPY